MTGDPSTVGDLKLYYTTLSAFADTSVHIDNLNEEYWLSKMAYSSLLLRDYSNIPNHNLVTIRFELMIIDISQFDYLLVSIDSNY